MRATLCLSMVLVTAGFAGDDAARKKPPERRDPDQEWAKRIVTDFFEAVNSQNESAIGLLSPALAKAYATRWIGFPGYSSPSFASHEMAPNQCEVILSGTVKGRSGWNDADFSIRVAKESSGVWSIRFINMRERKAAKPAARNEP